MREVGTYLEEDITVPSQNRPSCTRVIRFGLESPNYARVASHATALTSRCGYHSVSRVRAVHSYIRACVHASARVCTCVTIRGRSGSPRIAGSRLCRRFAARKRSLRGFVLRGRNREKGSEREANTRYAAPQIVHVTRSGNARTRGCTHLSVCVCLLRARIVVVVSLSLPSDMRMAFARLV